MNETTLKTIVVDALAAYLATAKSAAQIASDLRVAKVGDGFTESNLRSRVRGLIGATESEVAKNLDSLDGVRGTANTFTRTAGTPVTYSVVADES